jgi:hypothetical protein
MWTWGRRGAVLAVYYICPDKYPQLSMKVHKVHTSATIFLVGPLDAVDLFQTY